jgi:hypothetical protein
MNLNPVVVLNIFEQYMFFSFGPIYVSNPHLFSQLTMHGA